MMITRKRLFQTFILSVLVIATIWIIAANRDKKFVSADWKYDDRPDTMKRRQLMVDDLINSGVLIDLKKEQVVALLGSTETLSVMDNELVYQMGQTPSFLNYMDYDRLLVSFGEYGKVKSVVVVIG